LVGCLVKTPTHPRRVYRRRLGARYGRSRSTERTEHVLSIILALWRLVLTGHRHAGACASRAPPSAGPSNKHGRTLDRRTDDDQTQTPVKANLEAVPEQAQESPCRPRKPGFAIKLPRDENPSGQPSRQEHCALVRHHHT
jgi:hypothetical protein